MKGEKTATWKRGVALLLAVVLTVGLLSSGVFAADNMELSFLFTNTSYEPITSAAPGSTVYLGLKVENYIPIISYSMRIRYDAEKLDFYADYNLGSGRNAEFKNGVDIVSALAPVSCNADEDQGYVTITFAADTAASSEDAVDENNVILYLAFKVLEIGTAKVSYDTNNGQGGYLWDIATTGGTQIDVDLQEEIFQGIAPGVILDKTEVQVDGTNGATVQASAFNTNLEDITADGVVWSVSPTNNTGVHLGTNKAGEIVVDANAVPGKYCVTADKAGEFEDKDTASAYFTVSRAPSVAKSMEISCDTLQLTVPTSGDIQKIIPFTATVKDQYGETISAPVTWSLVETYPGITMDSETGKLTITSKASACTLQVRAIYGALEKTSEFAVTKAPSSATSTFIMKDGERIVSDVVPIPTGDTPNSVRYTCEIWDQFDQVMEGEGQKVKWSIANFDGTEITISGVSVNNGTLTVTKEANPEASFLLKAEYTREGGYGPQSGVSITLKNIEITWPEVTLKEDPVYGDTWEQIVTDFTGGSASFNEQDIPGEFTLVSTGRPNAGNQSYTIQFASTDGKYVVTKTEPVNIAKRPVTLTWSGDTNLVYDGSAKNVTATVGNVLEDDDCTITVTSGTATNAGTHTATASLSGAASGNYLLPENATYEYTIAPADYQINLSETVSVKVGTNGIGFLPIATTVGVKNETPDGTLNFYTDASRTTDVTGEWVSKQSLGDHTLYWSFTTTNNNYVAEAKTGTITMTVIEGDPQYISFADASKTVTYGDAAFTNSAIVTTTGGASVSDGGAITYQSSDNDVVTVNANGQVTIVGAGSATITATAAAVPGQYAQGTGSYTVTVNPKTLTETMVADVSNETYSGSPIRPEPAVTDGEALVKDVDFTYGYQNNTNAGTAMVTVTGKGNYQGTITKNFTINKADYEEGTVAKTVSIVKNRTEAQTGTLTAAAFLTETLDGATITGISTGTTNVLSKVPTVEDGVLSYTSRANLTGTISDDVYTVTIESTNYNDFTVTLTFQPVDKEDAQITLTAPKSKTYGDDAFQLSATVANPGANGKYTWSVTNGSVTGNGSKATASIANAGTMVVTVTYESDTTMATATANITINKATVTVRALNQQVRVGMPVPTLGNVLGKDYAVEGLGYNDKLGGTVTLSYAKTPNTSSTGRYEIVPAGGTVPNTTNYNADIVYESGYLTVVSNEKPQVTVTGGTHGFATISDPDAKEGDVVTIQVTCDPGYEVDEVTVTTLSGKSVRVTKSGGKYTFVMPEEKVKIQVTYQEIQEVAYTDVVVGSWYEEAVAYVSDNGLMNGVGGGKFAPNRTVTRAMVWTVLARMDGEDTASTSLWYAKAQQWAMETGVSDGTNAESAITREQLATMLYRYYGSPAVSGSLSGYADGASVSDWAKDAMVWAVQEGLIQGTGANKLSPTADTTRAQLAQILMRLDLKF